MKNLKVKLKETKSKLTPFEKVTYPLFNPFVWDINYPYCIIELVWLYHQGNCLANGMEPSKTSVYIHDHYSVEMINKLFEVAELTEVERKLLFRKYNQHLEDDCIIHDDFLKHNGINDRRALYIILGSILVKLERAIQMHANEFDTVPVKTLNQIISVYERT